MAFHVPSKYRVRSGEWRTDDSCNFGAFFIPNKRNEPPLKIIATDGLGEEGLEPWEHVSVSLPHRCPTWDEMCRVKDLFWDGEDCVLQFHPPRSEYVNNHQYCLHLWRPVASSVPLPPAICVGVKSEGVMLKERAK